MRSESGIIAIGKRPRRFCEHRDSDFSSDSRQGFENGDVAMLAAFIRITRPVSELLQQVLELPATRAALRVDQFESRQDQVNLRRHGLDNTREREETRPRSRSTTSAPVHRRMRCARRR